MSKVALITGVSGQDSIELSKYLLTNLEYKVFCVSRRSARPLPRVIQKLKNEFGDRYNIVPGDITDMASIIDVINLAQPDEFYNLAAQSHVGLSFDEPLSTFDITGKGVANCLEAIVRTNKAIRFYQAGSSEQFGGTKSSTNKWMNSDDLDNNIDYIYINEDTPFSPKSPYACAKVFGHNITANYREAYGLHASVGLLFNHEGIYRKKEFVTRKITSFVAKLMRSGAGSLPLGSLNFARDWGAAKDYVKVMHTMLQQDNPDDYIIATGKVHTGRQLLDIAFGYADLNWQDYVTLDKAFERPSDVKVLVGDATKAQQKLGFKIETDFQTLIEEMIRNDVNSIDLYGEVYE